MSNVYEEGTVKAVTFDHVTKIYLEMNCNKSKTAKYLGISVRTLRHWMNEWKGLGWIDPIVLLQEPKVDPNDEFACEIFPTNEYRLAYRDKMLNKDFL